MARDISPLSFEGEVKFQTILLDNEDLGTGSADFSDSQALDGRLRLTIRPLDGTTLFWEGRALKTHGSGNIETDSGTASVSRDYLEWRQSWIAFENLFNFTPLGIKIGRQRFSEPRALWWNRDFDALRLTYDTTLFKGFAAVGENLTSYRTSGDDFMEDDRDILRMFGEGSWQWRQGHFAELRGLILNDHSGAATPGDLVPAFDRDDEDARLFWAGARVRGVFGNQNPTPKRIGYSFEFLGLLGNTKTTTSSAGPGPEWRTVTGNRDEDVRAWALDTTLDIPVNENASLILGYAYGSGDGDAEDGENNAFRQNGLHSNFIRPGLASSTLNAYGSVLRPELSNIHILTAGYSAAAFSASDISALYHYYWLADEGGTLRSNGLDVVLSGTAPGVGHGLDLMMNTNLNREFGIMGNSRVQIDLKMLLGAFLAGAAFDHAGNEIASRGVLELRFRY